jgi:hypothetical protein
MDDNDDPTSIAQGFARRDREFANWPVSPIAEPRCQHCEAGHGLVEDETGFHHVAKDGSAVPCARQ